MQLDKEIKKEKNARISIQVTVDKSSVNEARESVIRDFTRKARLPGFRKGKVPRNLILQRFSQDIQKETVQAILSRSLSQVLEESEYSPISHPRVTDMGDLSADENFSFTAECDVLPEVTLPDYKSITGEKYVYQVPGELVDREIEKLRERFATLAAVDREADYGDYLVVDYQELPEEEEPGEKKTNQTVLLDREDERLAQGLKGAVKGESREIDLEQDYETEEGEKARYRTRLQVQVHEVKEKRLPEPNDEFAQDISDAQTLEELKTKVREDLEEQAARLSERKTKDELMSRIIEQCSFEIPETMIDNEIDYLLADIVQAYRIDVDKLRQDPEKLEQYRKNLKPRAVKTLKYELVLGEIAKQEDIQVSEEELSEEIKKYAEQQKQDVEEVRKQLEERGVTGNIRFRMRISKALDQLYRNAKLGKERRLTFGEEDEEEHS
jgi:trigger factor